MIIRSPRYGTGKIALSDAKKLLQHYRSKADLTVSCRERLFLPGGLNRSPQHFILEGKDGVWDGTEISSRFYCGGEDGVMGSLEAWGVAEGDWTSLWQALIVDLFSGGSAWWDSSCAAASLQVGIDACGTRGVFQRCYGTSISPVDRQTAWPLTLDGEPGNESQWRL